MNKVLKNILEDHMVSLLHDFQSSDFADEIDRTIFAIAQSLDSQGKTVDIFNIFDATPDELKEGVKFRICELQIDRARENYYHGVKKYLKDRAQQ